MMLNQKSVFILILSLSISGLFAQNMVMHGNDEAVKLIEEALNNMGHDMGKFGANITKATEIDETMVMANFLEAMNPDHEEAEAKVYIDRVQSYEGEMSDGEKIMVEMSTHFGEEDYNFFTELSQLAKAYPADPRVQLLVGTAYMYGENAKEGVPYLEKALEGEMLGAYNMLGYAYMGAGKMEEAKAKFDAYMELAPNHFNPHDSMGDYYMATENYEAAAAAFDKAAELNPDFDGHAKKAAKAREMMNK